MLKPGLREKAGLFAFGRQLLMEITSRMFHAQDRPQQEGRINTQIIQGRAQ
jgi:hypothetical protein